MSDDLEDEIDPLEGTEGAGAPRIARPPAASTIPPLTLRGVGGGASPNPEGSTEDLENRGLAAHTQPRPIATPSPLESKIGKDQTELSRLQSTGSGISQIAKAHPVAGGILRGLNTVGEVASAFLPQAKPILRAIPGTEEHHQQLIGRQEGLIGEDLGEQKEQTGIGEAQARTGQAEAAAGKDTAEAAKARREAEVAGNPKQGLTPEETTIHDLMTGENGQPRINPETSKPYSYLEAYQAVNQAKQDTKPDPQVKDKEKDIADYLAANKLPDTPANRETARKAIAERGKQEPGNFMPLYDDKGHVTGAWDPKSGRIVKGPELAGTTTGGAAIASKADAAAKKESAPYQQMIENAAEAHNLADMAAKGNASADVDLVLSFFKMMKGTGGAGVRFTQQEQNMILGARNAGQGLVAIGQKVLGEGQPLTPEQRANMVAVMDMHAKAAQTHIDSAKGGEGKGGAEPVYATNQKTKERVMTTDGGKTWQPAPAQ